jgi:hypothetical protein
MAKVKTFLLVEDDAYLRLFVMTEFEKIPSDHLQVVRDGVEARNMWRAWTGMRTAIGIRCLM